jgi:hypothetical protein
MSRDKRPAAFFHIHLEDAYSLLMLTDNEPQKFQSSRPPAIRDSQLSLSVEPSTRTLLLYLWTVLFQHSSTSLLEAIITCSSCTEIAFLSQIQHVQLSIYVRYKKATYLKSILLPLSCKSFSMKDFVRENPTSHLR